MPCSARRAQHLLRAKRARVHRLHPFTIRLVDRTREASVVEPVLVRIDPGLKESGAAVLRVDEADRC